MINTASEVLKARNFYICRYFSFDKFTCYAFLRTVKNMCCFTPNFVAAELSLILELSFNSFKGCHLFDCIDPENRSGWADFEVALSHTQLTDL